MCGLAGIIVRDHKRFPRERVERLLDALLVGVDSRGGDATGVVAFSEGDAPWLVKASCAARPFNHGRPLLPSRPWAILGHTRFATQGSAAFPFNNHPVRVGDTYVTHNGHIVNDVELIRESGRRVFHHVDSAAVAAILEASAFETHAAITAALEKIEGAAAIVAASPSHLPGRILLARGSANPLVIHRSQGAVVWASTAAAIQNAWRAAVGAPPSLGSLEYLTEGTAYLMSATDEERLTFVPQDGWKTSTSYGGWTATYKPTTTKYLPATKANPEPTKGKKAPKLKKARGRKESRRVATAAPSKVIVAVSDPADWDECDGCGTPDDWTTLVDMGVGYFCANCIAVAEDTGYLPGFTERYAGVGS